MPSLNVKNIIDVHADQVVRADLTFTVCSGQTGIEGKEGGKLTVRSAPIYGYICYMCFRISEYANPATTGHGTCRGNCEQSYTWGRQGFRYRHPVLVVGRQKPIPLMLKSRCFAIWK